MPGCVGVASELCGYDPEYRGIVESLLGRTVVAKDLDSGIAIMRAGNQAFRLVTLQGDVMHSGGSMTGGSIQQKAQNLLGREREMQELQEALKRYNQSVQQAQAEITEMENRRGGEKERREAAQNEVHQQEIAVVRDTEHLKAAQSEWDKHRQRMEELTGAIGQLEESLTEIREELQKMEKLSTQQDGGMEEMNRRTEELTRQLDTARREREAAQEALTDAMLTLQNAEHDCDRLQRDQKRLTGDRDDCQREWQETR